MEEGIKKTEIAEKEKQQNADICENKVAKVIDIISMVVICIGVLGTIVLLVSFRDFFMAFEQLGPMILIAVALKGVSEIIKLNQKILNELKEKDKK